MSASINSNSVNKSLHMTATDQSTEPLLLMSKYLQDSNKD